MTLDPIALLVIAVGLPLALAGTLLMRFSLTRKRSYDNFVSRRASVFNSITDAELRQLQDGATAACLLTTVIHG